MPGRAGVRSEPPREEAEEEEVVVESHLSPKSEYKGNFCLVFYGHVSHVGCGSVKLVW